MSDRPNLRTQLAARLAGLGWSQSELARRAVVHRGKLSAFLAGKADLNAESLERLIDALGGATLAWRRDPDGPHRSL